MMTMAATQTSRSRGLRLGMLLAGAAILVGVSWWMVGPAPKPADEGFPETPPPLALPDDVPDDGELGRSAALLATGELDGARAGFTNVVAGDRESEAGQVGLVLSRWRTTGPISVERDLRQLVREYPESAFVALHLGMVQSLVGDARAARETLRTALELGRAAEDATSRRMARLANDLLYPEAFRGDMPVLVSPSEVPPADRANVKALLAAVGEGDRSGAAALAAKLERSDDGLTQVAGAAGAFDKGEPDDAIAALDAIAADSDMGVAARDRARMLAALASAWSGSDRDVACRTLRRAANAPTDPATRRIAKPISAELCSA